MKVNKKQVRGMLKVLKNKSNNSRISLQYLSLKDGKITITDSYQLYQFNSDLNHDGQIHYTELEKWYKLSSSKDTLDLDSLEFKDCDINYPGVDRLLKDIEYQKIDSIRLNTDFIATASLVLNMDNITFNFTGPNSVIQISNDSATIKGIILPMIKRVRV